MIQTLYSLFQICGICLLLALTIHLSAAKGKGKSGSNPGKGNSGSNPGNSGSNPGKGNTGKGQGNSGSDNNSQIPNRACNGLVQFISVEEEGFIQTPKYPQKYDANQDCRWKFFAQQYEVRDSTTFVSALNSYKTNTIRLHDTVTACIFEITNSTVNECSSMKFSSRRI